MSNLGITRAMRLDRYVVEEIPSLSRSFAAKLIEQGKVSVNGDKQTKPGYKLREADLVMVDYDPAEKPEPEQIHLEVLYEDNDCVVINKPAGVLTHSKGAFNPEGTVATWLRGRLIGMAGERAGIVHRLDRATSGVMIAAKNEAALSWLQKQFSQRRVKKTYIAIVAGSLQHEEAVIDMPIERNPKHPQTFRVGSNGKPAVTAYKVLEQSTHYSMLELMPTTGRTHQLRVHLEKMGHPILGDTLYGGPQADRLCLHAYQLELTLPNRERKVFTVDVPPAFHDKMAEK